MAKKSFDPRKKVSDKIDELLSLKSHSGASFSDYIRIIARRSRDIFQVDEAAAESLRESYIGVANFIDSLKDESVQKNLSDKKVARTILVPQMELLHVLIAAHEQRDEKALELSSQRAGDQDTTLLKEAYQLLQNICEICKIELRKEIRLSRGLELQ